MPASTDASKTRLASSSGEVMPFRKVVESPKVMAPRLKALTRRPHLPSCRISICNPLSRVRGIPLSILAKPELPRRARGGHEAHGAEDGPLRAPGPVITAEHPED